MNLLQKLESEIKDGSNLVPAHEVSAVIAYVRKLEDVANNTLQCERACFACKTVARAILQGRPYET